MADEDVDLQFGAKIDKLTAAVEQSKTAIESIKASADKVGESFKHMGEVFGIALSIEGLKGYVESMTELGLSTERAQVMLGASAETIQVLAGIAKITGGSLEGMVMSMERLHLGMMRATADAFTPQAQAARALNINVREFLKLPAAEWYEALNAAVSKFNPSMNLANALQQLGGRGIVQNLPALLLTTERYKELQNAIKESNAMFAYFAPAAAETHQKLTLLGLAVQGFGERLFMVLKPAIDGAADALTKWIKSIDAKTIASTTIAVGNAALSVLQVVGNLVLQIKQWFDELSSSADGLANRVKKIAAGAAAGLASPVPGGAVMGGIAGLMAGGSGSPDIAKKAEEDRAKFDAQIAEWRKSWAAMRETFEKGAEDVHNAAKKLDAPEINEGARQQVEAQQARIEAEITAIKGMFAQKKALYDADAAQWKISDDKKFALTMAASEQMFADEREKLLAMQKLWPAHTKEWEMVQKKLVQATQQHGLEMIRLNAESVAAMQAKWHEWLSGISTAFTGQIRGLIQGTVTFAQAFRNIMLDLLMFFIQQVEKMVVQWAAAQLAQVTATQSAEGAKAAASVASEAITLPARIARFSSNIIADAAETFAGVFANLAPAMGPYAAGPASAASTIVMSQLAAVPKFAVGTPYVPFTGLAIVHKGERITTAEDNAKGMGSPQVNVMISAWDGASVQRWLAGGGARQLAKSLGDHWSNNPTSRGKF